MDKPFENPEQGIKVIDVAIGYLAESVNDCNRQIKMGSFCQAVGGHDNSRNACPLDDATQNRCVVANSQLNNGRARRQGRLLFQPTMKFSLHCFPYEYRFDRSRRVEAEGVGSLFSDKAVSVRPFLASREKTPDPLRLAPFAWPLRAEKRLPAPFVVACDFATAPSIRQRPL